MIQNPEQKLLALLLMAPVPALSGDVWLPLPNGAGCAGPHGQLVVPMGGGNYMNNKTAAPILREPYGVYGSHRREAVLVAPNGAYAGDQGSTGFVMRSGAIFEGAEQP